MKNIVRFAVNNPVSIWMLILAVGLLGFISLSRLGSDLFPDINTPKLYIEVVAGELSPEEIERQFVENIETLAIRQKGVTTVSSDVSVGSALITVIYDYDQDMDDAFLDMQKNLTSYQQNSDADEINISKYDPNASPVLEAAFVSVSNQNMSELRKIAEKQIVNELIQIEGIADVEIDGAVQQEIVIETNQAVLKSYGLTADDITNSIDTYNQEVSGGYIEESGQQYTIKGTGLLQKPEDLKDLVVGYRTSDTESSTDETTTSTPILLSEVATVKTGTSDPESIVSYNGKQCLGILIYKETGYNTVKAVETLMAEFSKIEQRLPGFKLIVTSNQGTVISNAVGEVQSSGLWGIVLAVFVLYLFLRRIGVTLIISIAIPISVIATFNLMYFNGLSLNIMTLGGLALGAGMLVDNSIVAIDNIYKYIEKGWPVREAAIEGISTVGGALISSTLTTIVVFLPVVYLHGASGELFKDQAWTVAFSLISSLFVSILLIPVLVCRFFSTTPAKKKTEAVSFNSYGRLLEKILNKRNSVLLFTLVLFALAAWVYSFIGSEFMPTQNSNELTLKIKMPAGTSLQRTTNVANQIGDMVKEMAPDDSMIVFINTGVSSGDDDITTSGNNTGSVKLLFVNNENPPIDLIIAKLESSFSNLPGLSIEYDSGSTGFSELINTDGAPFEVQVSGEELEPLMLLTKSVKDSLLNEEELMVTYTSFEEGAPEIAIKIDRYRAGVFNVGVSDIISQISQYLEGTSAGTMDFNSELTDIMVKMPKVTLSQLRNLKISSGDNHYLLHELADITKTNSPAEIERVNQKRTGKIMGYPKGNIPFNQLVENVQKRLSNINLPQGYQIKVAGEELKRKESFNSLMFALILSIILVYMVMASQFESLVHPFIILLSIPLAAVGVVFLFFITGSNFNIMALIGVVMLGGIAVNNGILLVDAINRNKREGMSRREAIIDAGQKRIRPILMTSATTVLGLLPLTFSFGESASLRSPMAMAVIGGLVSATLLTLVVIPCLYDLIDQIIPQKNSEPENENL